MESTTFDLNPASRYFQRLINRMTTTLDMTPIPVYQAGLDRAIATLYLEDEDKTPIIVYDAKHLEKIVEIGEWAVIAMFAHEVCYHYNLDLAEAFGRDPKVMNNALDADFVAGRMMKDEGCKLDTVAMLYEFMCDYSDHSDPDRRRSLAAMRDGWFYVEESTPPPPPTVQQTIHVHQHVTPPVQVEHHYYSPRPSVRYYYPTRHVYRRRISPGKALFTAGVAVAAGAVLARFLRD